MLSKKTFLILSCGFALITFILGTLEPFRLCGDQWRQCIQVNYVISILLLPTIPLFLFSLITYKMRDDIYRAWFRFARWAIPLSMFFILIAPTYSNDRMYPIEKGSIALLTSVLFSIVSVAIILYRLFVSRSRV